MLQAFLKDDSGATAIEYGFIAGLVSITIIASLISVGGSVNLIHAQINDGLAVANGTPNVEAPVAVVPGDVLIVDPVLVGNAIAIR